MTDKSLPAQQSSSSRQSQHHTSNVLDDDQYDEQDGVGEDEGDDREVMEEVKVAEQIGTFDEIIVWEHDGPVDQERDGYVRGLKEWVGWAGCMHGDDEEDQSEAQQGGVKK